ncbi:SH3 domain-containing protein [Cavenderia fasciculata]|uniref:SH3 domain-containing protein n=1 Tax=Cavenderia fasciculata TaxID=261658 RepID=F4PPQ0_CACFS|nr:SH3 domain-containing protein [Cavenderia fasciculata]EGG22363.1 SH3 domain-containing protein [Cavenderia fasciculata]|eukprot:XP_004360214.1 SH3 domain-containing protein [Cavenderia fasciculata]
MTSAIRTRGFSEDLWDKFEGVVKKVENGKVFTNTMSKFLSKQQQIESAYAKSMIKLCKDKSLAPDMEIGTLRDSWQVYRDQLEAISNLHDEFSQKLEKLIASNVEFYLEESRKQRKALVASGEKLTKDLKTAEANESKAKQNYEKLKKKQEEAHEDLSKQPPGAKEQKARKNVETATKAADRADNEYKDSVKQLQLNQTKFYHEEMPKILDDLQRFEVERLDKTKDWMLDIIKFTETIPPLVSISNENIRKGFENIDRDKDIQSFIMEKMSGAQKPAESQYEPYQSSSHLSFSALSTSQANSPLQNGENSKSRHSLGSSISSSSGGGGRDSVTSSPINGANVTNSRSVEDMVITDTVRALYDYSETEENEISFKSNNIIKVIMKDESGWWRGTVVGGDGKIGMFPSNFVLSTDSTQTKKVDVAGSKCKVLYDYHSDCEGELGIKEGELLTIEYEDEGWFFGSNEKNESGRFPKSNIDGDTTFTFSLEIVHDPSVLKDCLPISAASLETTLVYVH